MKSRAAARVSLAAGLWLAVATAPVAAETATRFRDWVVLPMGPAGCVAAQRLVAAGPGLTIGDVFLAGRDGGGAILSLRVPLGADLSTPAAYRLGGGQEAVPLIWQSCDADSCLAQIEVTPGERARLSRARAVTLAFRPTTGSPPLRVPVSLMGVTAALRAQAACSGGRAVPADAVCRAPRATESLESRGIGPYHRRCERRRRQWAKQARHPRRS